MPEEAVEAEECHAASLEVMKMILLTRKAEFSASHYYWNEAWSAEENERVFGKCANKNGHGHNYTLEVTVAGEVDEASGFVVDLKQLKDVMEREVVGGYDHRHLNKEVPEFARTIPTTENIAIAVWKRLDGKIPGAKLHRVRVYEMPDLFADYYGEP
jgi:6-pyruvoyltetrahydropterin/6-carboxytetrahydropterin synthase